MYTHECVICSDKFENCLLIDSTCGECEQDLELGLIEENGELYIDPSLL